MQNLSLISKIFIYLRTPEVTMQTGKRNPQHFPPPHRKGDVWLV